MLVFLLLVGATFWALTYVVDHTPPLLGIQVLVLIAFVLLYGPPLVRLFEGWHP